MTAAPSEQFVSEAIEPVAGTADIRAMSRGEPGLPARFTWRGREYRVVEVLSSWKTSGPCRSGGGELYLRRHWHRVLTEPRGVMRIYCERQASNPRRPKARWWLYSIEGDPEQP